MTFRPGPLRAAAALAAGFLVVRVVYRVLFAGAGGDGALLLDLPSWRLPAPFAHVELLGPVTWDGIADAAASALPIAASLLVVGVIVAALDVPRLLARAARRGPLQGTARALAIAWATLPALAEAARRARRAARLRGERPGPRLLAPILERTLERATTLGAALEVRGYAGRGAPGACERPVELRGAAFGFASRTVARVDDLVLPHGSLTLLVGPTGSGKTTLLRALAGLHGTLDSGWLAGEVRVVGLRRADAAPRDTARTIGVVLQDPRAGFATERVRDEIGLTLELRGVAPVLVDARVREVAERTGVTALLDRPLRGLSAGEATLVAIAAAVVDHPILLLVDEPLADLDAGARHRIVDLLDRLAHEAGVCVVVSEHRAAELAPRADRIVAVGDPHVAPLPLRRAAASGATALRARGITVRHGDITAVSAADVEVAGGEIVALMGANGAGKSSLLEALALGGQRVSAPGRVALVPDASDDLFVRDSVARECRRADRRAGVAAGDTAARFAALVGLAADDAAMARHPRDLSTGQRRCLAIALQTAGRPAVVLVDEPTRGLDPAARALVAQALIAQAETGVAVLFATHDGELVSAIADRVLAMRGGVVTAGLTQPHPPREVGAEPGLAAPDSDQVAGFGVDAAPASDSDVDLRIRDGARTPRWRAAALVVATLAAVAAFAWPLAAPAVPSQAQDAVPVIALALAPIAVLLVFVALDASIRSAQTLALLATLAAIGAAIRIVGTGVGGVEALFVLLILAGRAYGARFGMLLGAASLALSSLVFGGVGPWLPFQMFACGWVAAGAGLLPKRVRGRAEVAMLAVYGVVASYLFGLVMNLWFWPFAVGAGTSISYEAGAPIGENLASFALYSLVTSTAGWDTVRAVTTVIGVLLVGRAVLAALRRAKPVAMRPVRAPTAPGRPAIVRSL
ncbi:ATP-binding cassette domain-containing protein [Microbacterium sp. EYE_5]|uniref:ATP-binding cassette domain-containing protein n=1 Tax=unclassified Microbacterium TaxID=2609290 RepID=UPI002003296D|nr:MULTISPECIES: ATP-binding cassette domain-containing protein [unclassified Microbacterium]MCK6080165.1 ATP-binding cassette domain-containing protein [Microbacterium sp. EYE_382]MCK6085436.1 ATP-binding cassette domain-containing protein [Microbacterium sp. EYE_384]MCK6122339.1 ATP-binding cassette domain-containing protein [Microbacterium sp. EYE_80]MCK6126199.1 ATP-binding cassette domain-containing protein [Microbacterium sp. EYE_79]MCK6141120.1 ATP-binding cassette domain-containing pro